MTEIVVGDVGGTHARFALARVEAGRVTLGEPHVYKTAEYPSIEAAAAAFGAELGRPLPQAVSLAVACAIAGDVLKMTNNPWTLRPAAMREAMAPEGLVLVNDFGAVGRAVAHLGPEHFQHICGPETLSAQGVTTVLGPGTGLGVAQLVRSPGRAIVIETEGGHIGFCARDPFEDRLLARLRARHGRVSLERVLSGPGLGPIHATLAADQGREVETLDDTALWTSALEGSDPLAVAALDRFCEVMGAAAGDYVLAHGANELVLAGGLGARLAGRLGASGFAEAFADKGRFRERMGQIPVRLIVHPQPGLLGAAHAYAEVFEGPQGADAFSARYVPPAQPH
jgi:glucokinase